MRVLVVMAHYPFPPRTGGALVAYNSLRHLSRRHTIEFVGLAPDGVVPPAQFLDKVTLVPQRPISRLAHVTRHITYLLADVPMAVSRFTFRDMKAKVRDAIRGGGYDVVLLFDMSAVRYVPRSAYGKLVVNVEDPQSIKLRRMAPLPVWSHWQRAKLRILTWLARREELRTLPRMARVLLLSQADLDDMRADLGINNLSQVSYGVTQPDAAAIPGLGARERVIIYSGSMYHPPNVDGALWLLNEIFPLVLRHSPNARLQIVGPTPTRAYSPRPNVSANRCKSRARWTALTTTLRKPQSASARSGCAWACRPRCWKRCRGERRWSPRARATAA